MKKLLLVLFCLEFCGWINAQQPTIHGYTIIPSSPTHNTPVKLVTHISTPNSSFLVDKSFTITSGPPAIKLHLCYSENLPTVITHHTDTFAVGQLAAGVYPVKLSAYMSIAGQHCARIDSNFIAFTVTVTGNVGLREYETSQVKIYPNPAKDYVIIESGELKDLRILSIQGQVIRDSRPLVPGKISLDGLSSGLYWLEFNSPGGRQIRKLVVE